MRSAPPVRSRLILKSARLYLSLAGIGKPLAAGKADAFATDDVLLYGFIARKKAEATMAVVGDFITYEAYGLMFRKDDPQMAAAVARAYAIMAQDGDLVSIYHKWFLRRAPTGELIDLPISLQLTEAWRALGVVAF